MCQNCIKMRTTIDIAPDLLRQAKHLAAERGVTLSSLVNESLRLTLGGNPTKNTREFQLRTSPAGRLRRDIDFNDNSAVLDALDELDPKTC